MLLSLSQESVPGEPGSTPQKRVRATFTVVGMVPLLYPVGALGAQDATDVRAVLGYVLNEHRASLARLPPPIGDDEDFDDEPLEPLCPHLTMSAANGALGVKAPKLRAGSDPFQNRAVAGVSSGVGAVDHVLACEIRTYDATCGTCFGKVLMQLCRTPEG